MQNIKIIVNCCLFIALYYLVYYLYLGLVNPIPILGDSWSYHIPISLSILNGSFLTHPAVFGWFYPGTTTPLQPISTWFYPGSAEAINSLFIALHIPLTISNIIAIVILFFTLFKLGLVYKLNKYYSLLFSLSFVSLNGVVRWMNAVSIDIWVAVFYTLILILLQNPKKNLLYFAKLGLVGGLLIGSKYSAIYFLAILFLVYAKDLIKIINFKRIIAFTIPFSLFGLFWYVRNYLEMGNPFYPVSTFLFNESYKVDDTILIESIKHPLEMFNAAFSEYHFWTFSFLVAIYLLIHAIFVIKKFKFGNFNKLILIGVLNFLIFLNFPTGKSFEIMVTSFRYSYPVFIVLILAVFILAEKHKKEEWIGYFSLANMLPVLSMVYYPKILFAYLPIGLIIVYLLNKKLED